MDVLVDLDGYTDAVALPDAEGSGEGDFLFQMVFLDRLLEQFYDFRRTGQMAGTANTNLNQHGIHSFMFLWAENRRECCVKTGEFKSTAIIPDFIGKRKNSIEKNFCSFYNRENIKLQE